MGRARIPGVKTEKLTGVDAFVVFDVEAAEHSAGITRLAPKVLVDGATWLARSQTYQFASFERQIGGASAGINAAADARAEAIAGFVAEVEPWVASSRFVTLPGKGVSADDLAPLRAVDPRPDLVWSDGAAITAAGVVAAADAATGGLDGRTIAIEGFDPIAVHVARGAVAQGARVVAVATVKGTAIDEAGFDPDTLAELFSAHGPAFIGELTTEPLPAGAVLGATADVLLAGSKAGAIDHTSAAVVQATVVVPHGAIPVTAKGVAVLRRAGTAVLPDFVTTAGLVFATDATTIDEAGDAAATAISAVIAEVAGAEDGPLLAACRRAEAFLATWVDPLPFGRPLA